MRVVRAAVAAAVLALLGLLVWDVAHNHGSGVAGKVDKGKIVAAPKLDLPRLGATGKLSLSSLRGKVVVVNFWESDCVPCREEAQAFNQVAKDDAAKGVAFVGIDDRDQKAGAISFDTVHHVTYPSIFDPTGSLALQFPHAEPASTPTTIVIDRAGDIAAKVSGELDYTHLVPLVNAVLREQA